MPEVQMDEAVTGDAIDDYALLLLNDALNRETSLYYIDAENQKVESIWDEGEEARDVAIFLRNPTVTTSLSYLALFDMLLSITSPPGIPDGPDWLMTLSEVLQLVIWLMFCVNCVQRVRYMWAKRDEWFYGAWEPPWVFIQMIVLFVLTPVEKIARVVEGNHDILQASGTTVHCPAPVSIFIQGWARAWTFIYFNRKVRNALVTLCQVFTCLGPLTALLLVSFIGHFFVFQGITIGVTKQEAGYGPQDGDVSTALYELFSLLTTVNHPDVMMWLVEQRPLAFPVIMSFMFFTSIIGLNLLLAIVYGEYVNILDSELEGKAELRSKMIETAFKRLLKDGKDFLTPAELEKVLRKCEGVEAPYEPTDEDKITMVVRLIDNDALSAGDHSSETQDHKIHLEDMKELMVLYTAPMNIISAGKPKQRHKKHMAYLEDIIKEDPSNMALQSQLEDEKDMDIDRWCATYKKVYDFAFTWGADPEGWKTGTNQGGLNPWQDRSVLVQVHNLWFLFYITYCIFATAETTVTTLNNILLLVSIVVQLTFVVVMFVAEMRPWQALHFLNPKGESAPANLSNLGLLICLVVEYVMRCIDDQCIDSYYRDPKQQDGNDFVVAIVALGKIFQVCNFAVETSSVYLLVCAVFKTLPTLGPHFGIFLAFYYGFAGMSIAFFCGKLTEDTLTGGPGYWDTVSGTSPAYGTVWKDTPYGSNPYYYNLNYDGFPQAIASLYVVMIQNNWNVAADGPIEVTNGNFRWFFVVYTIVVAFVMINVLVGAIIDSLDGVRQEMIRESHGEFDPLEVACQARIDATKGPSGKFYGETWELGDVELHGEVRYDTDKCDLFSEKEEVEYGPQERLNRLEGKKKQYAHRLRILKLAIQRANLIDD